MTPSEICENITRWFQENMPVAETELHYEDPYQLLVAVILSAQCTDKRVNMITPPLFERFPTVMELAAAETEDVFEWIKSCSYPNNKARNLVGMARKLLSDFQGIVPDEMDKLLQLPGVGRKTANVLLSVFFNKPAMAVDTHVFRVSARLGLTVGSRTPEETERQLVALFPSGLLPIAHHWLILHGRYVCQARKPLCSSCGLITWCANSRK